MITIFFNNADIAIHNGAHIVPYTDDIIYKINLFLQKNTKQINHIHINKL